MLPDIDTEQRGVPLHQRAVLIRRGVNLQSVIAEDEPCPSGAEPCCRGGTEQVAGFMQSTEGGDKRLFDFTADFAPVGAHDRPEERVVRMAAAVVNHRLAFVFGHPGEVLLLQKNCNVQVREVPEAFQSSVQVVDVALMVFPVVDFHRLCVNVRFQSIVRVRQCR